jgi:hypothetical protein
MGRAVWVGAVAALFLFAPPLVSAQVTGDIKAVACADSFVFLEASMTCAAGTGRSAGNSQVVTDIHMTWGRPANVALNFTLVTTGRNSYITPYSEATSAQQIKGYHKTTREEASNWSPIRTDGNTSYMTFKVKQVSCIGFDHAGPLVSGGYEWLLRGFLCLPDGQVASFAALKPYLAATRIGAPALNRNAFGQPVAPFPMSPKPA